jgi:acetylornithine deacetylase/succinyl-diaminopimelate desuccinylase-like protein
MNYFFAGWLWLMILVSAVSSSFAAETKIDWRAAGDEAMALLSRYIQIDTTNPPGNEIKAAQFFKAIFDKENIESRIIESQPGRGSIFARLKGDGTKKSLVLLNHMDVVPAEASLWKEPPFSGVIKDGVIWGRGSLDDKGAAIMELAAMLALKRQNISLRGDLIFLGTADEEAGGALGAGYVLDKHFELFKNVGLVFNEGGGIRVDETGRARLYNVSVAEKTPLWLKLTASGAPGHGSTPSGNMAVNKLIAALSRVMNYQTPIRVMPEVQQYYADTAMNEAPERRERYNDLRKALEDPIFRAEFIKDPRNSGNVRNTIAITGVKGSDKTNVIPAFATAELDVRLLPGEAPDVFLNELRKVVADESIKFEVLLSFPAATSPPHPEALKVISEFARSHDPGAVVVAPLVRGFTDCHFFREKAIPCLGFMPHRSTPSSEGLVHGVDERASLESLRFGIRAMFEIVSKFVAE